MEGNLCLFNWSWASVHWQIQVSGGHKKSKQEEAWLFSLASATRGKRPGSHIYPQNSLSIRPAILNQGSVACGGVVGCHVMLAL